MLSEAIALTLRTYKESVEQIDVNDPSAFHQFLFRWSGCLALDWVCGNQYTDGGLARGIIIEISGPENAGKTTIATLAAIGCQAYKKRSQVLIEDFEHKYNLMYAYEFGLDRSKDKLCFTRPKGPTPGEAGMDLLLNSVKDNDCGLCIVDSFAAILSKEEMGGELMDANIGKTAMLQSKAVKDIVNAFQPYSPTVIFINQIREVIGGFMGGAEKTSGARALKFYAAIRLDVRQVKKYKTDDGIMVGCRVKIKANKNQVSRNQVTTEIDIWFGRGPDEIGWCIEKAIELGAITKKGSKFTWNEEQVSLAKLTDMLSDKKELRKLYNLCVETNNLKVKQHLDEIDAKRGIKKEGPLEEPNPSSVEEKSIQ